MSAPDEQMTRAEVRALYAEGRYAEIVAAKYDGRLDTYLTSTDEHTDTEES